MQGIMVIWPHGQNNTNLLKIILKLKYYNLNLSSIILHNLIILVKSVLLGANCVKFSIGFGDSILYINHDNEIWNFTFCGSFSHKDTISCKIFIPLVISSSMVPFRNATTLLLK